MMIDKQKWLNKIKENRNESMPILTFPGIQALGITVNDLVNSATLQAQVMAHIAKTYPMSAALSMMDLSVEAEEFGAKIRFFPMEVPTVIGAVINSPMDAMTLMVPQLGNKRTKTYVEGVRLAKTLIKDKPVFAGVIGPFSLAGRLMDMTEIMVNSIMDPDMVHVTLEKATAFIQRYILAFKTAGADGIILAEPAAGLLSPEICEKFSSYYIRKIKAAVSDSDFLFIYHNCGNVVPLKDTILSIDADVYHFGDHIDLEDMLKIFPKDKLIMGNISPAMLLKKQDPEQIKIQVRALLERLSPYDNFIISSGCDIPPATPLENLDAYFEAIDEFYSNNRK
ncbi:MAG: methyltransferase [Acholeplasmataceae bacterium]|nr:methyltransferase [Acholeplasmataceae bacterium]